MLCASEISNTQKVSWRAGRLREGRACSRSSRSPASTRTCWVVVGWEGGLSSYMYMCIYAPILATNPLSLAMFVFALFTLTVRRSLLTNTFTPTPITPLEPLLQSSTCLVHVHSPCCPMSVTNKLIHGFKLKNIVMFPSLGCMCARVSSMV